MAFRHIPVCTTLDGPKSFGTMLALPPTLVALIFVSASRAASVIDFSSYPLGSQDCLYQASNTSNCATDTVLATNSCLCNNGGNFITIAAKCLGDSNPSTLEGVYDIMKDACKESNTPINVEEEQYLSAAGFTGTMTPPRPTATPVPPPSVSGAETRPTEPPEADDDSDGNRPQGHRSGKGLSSGARIGVIIAATIVGIAMAGAVVYLLLRHKRKKDNEESHPMLPQDNGPLMSSLVPTPAETSAMDRRNSPGAVEKDSPWRLTSAPTEQRNSGFNWETPDDLTYPGNTATTHPH